ncbi:MAG: hydrogenase small subunit [Deltaproteobacteria bacterium]|nr:hydrogenase small subunit [Deltaproteobacteria bacterium]
MKVGRRDFLKFCIGSAATLGLEASVVGKLSKALAAEGNGLATVVWLNGANCTGCTVSLANMIGTSAPTDIADLLINTINLAFHPNLMGAAGDLAVRVLEEATARPYILAVDGGIPTAFNGHACLLWTEKNAGGQSHEVTAMEAVQRLAPGAQAILAVGTCSSFGGIPGGNPNPTGIRSVSQLSGLPTVNIPGCPPHPNWIVSTIARFLAGASLSLDSQGRPAFLFEGDTHNVHKNCPRKGNGEARNFAQSGCLKELGCNGPRTQADCPKHLWNNGTNWCIGANAVCLACTENGFPDKFSPFYDIASGGEEMQRDFVLTRAEWRGDRSELIIGGEGKPGASAQIFDSQSSALIGATVVASSGLWNITVSQPSTIPCSIRAESEGQTFQRDVDNAPESCGSETPGPGAVPFEFSKAEWRSDTKELRLEGKASPGSNAQLFDAYSGDLLGSAVAASDGKWKLRLPDPRPVPCRVRADCGSTSLEMAVKDAPSDCGSVGPGALQFEFIKAEWRNDTKELRLEGKASPGSNVQLFDAYSGDLLGSAVAASDGKWKSTRKDPRPVPCRVRADCGSTSLEMAVKDAPSNCGSVGPGALPFEFKKAEWRKDNKELRLEGNASQGSNVRLFDAYSGNLLGSAKAASDGKWKLSLHDPRPVPCRVRADCGVETFEKSVKDAPVDCGRNS